MRRLVGLAATVTLAATLLTSCSDGASDDGEGAPDGTVTAPADPLSSAPSAPSSSAPPTSDRPTPTYAGPPRVVGEIATGLAAPWGLAFLPDGNAIVTEHDTTKVLEIKGPEHSVGTVGVLSDAVGLGDQGGEAGLLGVAVSPDFGRDHLLYFYLSTDHDNRIVKARLVRDRLGPATPILTGIPNGFIHDGGRLVFGPDGYLYASTGETGHSELAQDKDSLGGKILRITTDGEPAPGNPFPDSPVWSYGHRNVQGLAFDDAGHLWASEFGEHTYDELNLIQRGHNYGWPTVEGRGDVSGLTNPAVVWDTETNSPSGLAWLDGHLWLGALAGERLWRVTVDGTRASDPKGYLIGEYGRLRTVVAAPDGRLWVTTSNRDGRGDPRSGDDRILLVRP